MGVVINVEAAVDVTTTTSTPASGAAPNPSAASKLSTKPLITTPLNTSAPSSVQQGARGSPEKIDAQESRLTNSATIPQNHEESKPIPTKQPPKENIVSST